VLRATPPADSPKAGAFISLALNMGGSIASASLVTILDRRESFHSTILDGNATLARYGVAQFVAHSGIVRLAELIARESAALSYADAFYVIGAFGIVMAPLAFALPRRKAAGVPATR